MKFKNKRLRPSIPGTAPGFDAPSEADRKDSVQEQLNAIVNTRRKNPARSSLHGCSSSSAANVPPSVPSLPAMGDVKPRPDALATSVNATGQDVKANMPCSGTLGAAARALPAGPALFDNDPVTEAGKSCSRRSDIVMADRIMRPRTRCCDTGCHVPKSANVTRIQQYSRQHLQAQELHPVSGKS